MESDDLLEYDTVKTWMRHVQGEGISSPSTQKLYLHFLSRYCDFLHKNPDEIIAERKAHMKADDESIQRQHEELLIDWRAGLEKEGLARSSTVTAHGIIKSFYSVHYLELKAKPPKSWGATQRSVPTPSDLKGMIEVAGNSRDKALLMFLAQSGMGIGELPLVTYELIQGEYEAGMEPLHLPIERHKVMLKYDTFIGRDSLDYLEVYLEEVEPNPKNPIFKVSPRTLEYVVKNSSIKTGINPPVTPHKLRSFFGTFLALAKVPQPLIDYWMGHTVAYKGAYFIPPVDTPEGSDSQRRIYRQHESAISLPKS